jgi:hypothetical protein
MSRLVRISTRSVSRSIFKPSSHGTCWKSLISEMIVHQSRLTRLPCQGHHLWKNNMVQIVNEMCVTEWKAEKQKQGFERTSVINEVLQNAGTPSKCSI